MADNKEMKTLGGYEIVDEKAREEIHVVEEKADEALSLAKGATKAFVYDTYSDMISELNALDKAELLVNFHVMIRTVCVPDLWISGVSDEHVKYTYISNEDFIADLTEDGVVQVGYFILSALETQKVELDDYVKKDDFATRDKLGLVYANPTRGISVTTDGGLIIEAASSTDVDNRAYYIPITGRILDYAVMKALTDPKNHEWTAEQKQLARELLGAIGASNIASKDNLGVIKAFPTGDKNVPGVGLNGNNILGIVRATDADITAQENTSKPIVPSNLSYAIKVGLIDNKIEWTDEEKAKTLELLGGVAKVKPSSGMYLYGNNANGDVQYRISDRADAHSMARRGADGVLPVGTPTADNHATTKKYVDDLVSGVREAWRTIRDFTIENEEVVANDTESGITWTVDDDGNITSFEFDTDENGKALNANKLRYIIYPSEECKGKIFGGKRGYLVVNCNDYTGNIYNATGLSEGYRIQCIIEKDMGGLLRQVTYMGSDRNSYGNEKPHLNYFNIPARGYCSGSVKKLKVSCDPDIWFVSGTKVLVQICEEVG